MTNFLQSRGFEYGGSVFAGLVLAWALWVLMT